MFGLVFDLVVNWSSEMTWGREEGGGGQRYDGDVKLGVSRLAVDSKVGSADKYV